MANNIALAWAEGLSTAVGSFVPDSSHNTLELAKPVYAMNAFQHALLIAEFRFQGSHAAESSLIRLLDAAISSAFIDNDDGDLDGTVCNQLLFAVGMDFCGFLRDVSPHYHLESLDLQGVTGGRSSSSSKSVFSSIKEKKEQRRNLDATMPPTKVRATLPPTKTGPSSTLKDINKCMKMIEPGRGPCVYSGQSYLWYIVIQFTSFLSFLFCRDYIIQHHSW